MSTTHDAIVFPDSPRTRRPLPAWLREIDRDRPLFAALAVAVLVVFGIYVNVLRDDVEQAAVRPAAVASAAS